MGIELVYALGAIPLLGALVWGANHYRARQRGATWLGDQKTRDLLKKRNELFPAFASTEHRDS
jgi:hypothetical protein